MPYALLTNTADFKRLFEGNALLSDAQKEVVTSKFVAFIQDVLSRYLTAVIARFEVDVCLWLEYDRF